MAKAKKTVLTSPKGIAQYPHLNTPDTYEGVQSYKVNLIVDPDDPEATKYLSAIDDLVDQSFDEATKELNKKLAEGKGKQIADAKKALEALTKNYPYDDEYDDQGEATGRKVIKFKQSYKGKYKDGKEFIFKIGFFDSKGKGITNVPMVNYGSTLRVNGELNPYYMAATNMAGVSLRISAVKIVELSEGTGSAPAGFGEDEGDFTADDFDAPGYQAPSDDGDF